MILTSYGAAQHVTGSKHLITLKGGKKILLDCGMFQGGSYKVDELNSDFIFDPASIDYVILSHAHIDHCGLLPKLVKDGYQGKIFCTPATRELARLILEDSSKIQSIKEENDVTDEYEALYSPTEVDTAIEAFHAVPYGMKYDLDEDISLLFTDAGHVLGSAVVNLTIKDNGSVKSICFTGDLGRYENRILRPPQTAPAADVVICESTYGNKLHRSFGNTEDRLEELVRYTCVEKKGKLLVPCFSIGRTQELIYSFNYLAEEGRLPDIKVFVDSPLSVYATDIIRENAHHFNDTMKEYIETDPDPFGFEGIVFIKDRDKSKLLNALDEPCVIISSSGMMEGGRIRHHAFHNISNPSTTLLMTGYAEPSTLAGKIMRGAKTIRLFGKEVEVNADVEVMKEFSAHADMRDLMKFMLNHDKQKLKHIFLVHGEKDSMEELKEQFLESGYTGVEIPERRMSYEI